MLDIKDEYIRDYAFDPEFIQRKDFTEAHEDCLESKKKLKLNKKLKLHSKDFLESLSEEEIAMNFEQNSIDAEVYSFCAVNSKYWVNPVSHLRRDMETPVKHLWKAWKPFSYQPLPSLSFIAKNI